MATYPNWRLDVYNGVKALKQSYDNLTDPGGIDDGFDFTVASNGDCTHFQFNAAMRYGSGSTMNIAGGDIIHFFVGDALPTLLNLSNAVWYGVVIENPDYTNPEPQAIVAGSARVLLRDTLTAFRKFGSGFGLTAITDFSSIITNDVNGYKLEFPPGVKYNASKVQTGLGVVDKFYYPFQLSDVLDQLVAIVDSVQPVTWGVDAQGEFFFGTRLSSRSIDYYSDLKHTSLEQISSDEIVTKVRLILSDKNPYVTSSPNVGVTVRSDNAHGQQNFPIFWEYEAPEHPSFKRSVPRIMTSNTNYTAQPTILVKTPGGWATGFGSGLLINQLNTGVRPQLGISATPNFHGFVLRYSTASTMPSTTPVVKVAFELSGTLASGGGSIPLVSSDVDIPLTQGHNKIQEIIFFIKYDGDPVTGLVSGAGLLDFPSEFAAATDNVRVYAFAPLYYADNLTQLAKKEIRLPSSIGVNAMQDGYWNPVKTVSLTSSPSGFIGADTTDWHYTYSIAEGFTTAFTFGSKPVPYEVLSAKALDRESDRKNTNRTRLIAGVG